jgi:hypothetical protein
MLLPILVLAAATVYFGLETSLSVGVTDFIAKMLLGGMR